jgi:hypothetical protein
MKTTEKRNEIVPRVLEKKIETERIRLKDHFDFAFGFFDCGNTRGNPSND